MAGDSSTTEPPMLDNTGKDTYSIIIYFSLRAHFPLRARFCLRARFSLHAHFSLLLSDNILRIFRAQIMSCIRRESNLGLSRGRRNSTTEPPILYNTGRDILYTDIRLSACAFYLRANFSVIFFCPGKNQILRWFANYMHLIVYRLI